MEEGEPERWGCGGGVKERIREKGEDAGAAAVGGGACHVAARERAAAVSGRVGQCPARRGAIFPRVWTRRSGISEEGLFIGIEGARRVQMRCGFRPRDRDRKL